MRNANGTQLRAHVGCETVCNYLELNASLVPFGVIYDEEEMQLQMTITSDNTYWYIGALPIMLNLRALVKHHF